MLDISNLQYAIIETDDQYVPSAEEVEQAEAEAHEMNENMRRYGTIDKPEGL